MNGKGTNRSNHVVWMVRRILPGLLILFLASGCAEDSGSTTNEGIGEGSNGAVSQDTAFYSGETDPSTGTDITLGGETGIHTDTASLPPETGRPDRVVLPNTASPGGRPAPTTGGIIYGPPRPVPSTEESREAVLARMAQEAENKIRQRGHLVHHIPDSMVEQASHTVTLSISQYLDSAALVREIRATGLGGDLDSSNITHSRVQVAEVMVADLISPQSQKVEIAPLSSAEQTVEVERDAATTWAWKVTPLTAGQIPLTLSLHVLVRSGEKELKRLIKVYDHQVKVTALPPPPGPSWAAQVGAFLGEYWQWLLSTLVIPLIIWLNNTRPWKKTGGAGAAH